jgi:hypothetical protein
MTLLLYYTNTLLTSIKKVTSPSEELLSDRKSTTLSGAESLLSYRTVVQHLCGFCYFTVPCNGRSSSSVVLHRSTNSRSESGVETEFVHNVNVI